MYNNYDIESHTGNLTLEEVKSCTVSTIAPDLMPRSRLLSLPGEIRNLIYTYAIPCASTKVMLGPNLATPPTYPFNLAHVCQSMRTETFLLYPDIGMKLSWQDASAYITTFLLSLDPAALAEIHGKLVLEMFDRDVECTPMDILPIIKLRLCAPSLQIQCGSHGEVEWVCVTTSHLWRRSLNILFGTNMEDFSGAEKEKTGLQKIMQEKRRIWFTRGIDKVMLHTRNHSLQPIEVFVKEKYQEPWMAKYHSEGLDWFCIELGWTCIDMRVKVRVVSLEGKVLNRVTWGRGRGSSPDPGFY